jgi:hypothetical protein
VQGKTCVRARVYGRDGRLNCGYWPVRTSYVGVHIKKGGWGVPLYIRMPPYKSLSIFQDTPT